MLEHAWHVGASVSKQTDQATWDDNVVYHIMEAPNIGTQRIFGFFRRITSMPSRLLHGAMSKESVDCKQIVFS